MDKLICAICKEALDNERGVCSLPCGHVKHIDCLKRWAKEKKNCPNCWQNFKPRVAVRKRLYFDIEQNCEDNADGNTDADGESNDENKQHNYGEKIVQLFDQVKAEADAAKTHVKDLEKSTCDLEKKLQNSEAQKQQISNELHTSEAKNQETLERNRVLEQELSNSQAKNRDLEAKFDQTDVGQVIAVMKEKVDKLENGEIARLQKEVAKLSSENATKKQELTGLQLRLDESQKQTKDEQKRCQNLTNQMKIETDSLKEQIRKKDMEVKKLSSEIEKVKRSLSDCQTKLAEANRRNVETNAENAKMKREFSDSLEAADKRIADMIKEKEEMSKELKSWEHLRQLIGGANEYAEGIGKKKAEPKDEKGSQDLIPPHSIRKMPSWANALKRWNQDSGSDGDPTKRARIDIQKKSEESGAKKSASVASGSKAVVI
ncbi:ring finger domain-containing protein [Ditylenchus destructor]|uniref:Ring finger domain-containing protein n=1 Tax=Ditylenchus destructor TaxID=166010 RepID=A0AAD4MJG7_9BILA|nr:ring finger domain-containing protein [Ditylenchus destructor]